MTTYGYIILWRGKKYEKTVPAGTSIYSMKEQFCAEHRIPPKRRHDVTILLAEKDGEPVLQTAT